MATSFYSLADILSVAQVHPFYSDTQYPPTREWLAHILQAAQANPKPGRDLKSFPLTSKHTLYVSSVLIWMLLNLTIPGIS